MKEKKNQYRTTLNLPQTAFPMKADLARREPEFLKRWDESDLYHAVLKKNAGRPKYVLHDGPPYANGNIHFGHILNKVLKDIIVKYRNMAGFFSPYIPGWDCHGLPIEHQVDKDLGPKKRGMGKIDIRKACREYAMKYVNIQREEFKRLGVLGDWQNPYLTLTPHYEATIAREFGRFVGRGDVYKGLRPVLWCPHCRTALAEAEVEYEENESTSIYVRFPLSGDFGDLFPALKDKKISIVIWTTTPWTLPANLAVALHADYDYVVIPYQDEFFILAKNLVQPFAELLKMEAPEPVYRFSGKKLEKRLTEHPFLPRTSLVVLSDHVSLDTGTGCVHIAPGHGDEDHSVGKAYGLKTPTPVDHAGRFTDEAGVAEWIGLKVFEANPLITQRMRETGALLSESMIHHMYPHCWRCKNPVIFRATEQWFISLEKNDLRAKALDAIRRVQWVPAWGRERIYGMVEKRPDWCLSRQRSWGVPIIAFRCNTCNHLLLDQKIINWIADRFATEGSDIWFSEPSEKLLPQGTSCPNCSTSDENQMGGIGEESGISPRSKRGSGSAGPSELVKEEDILDVWFDSGVSFAAVLEGNPELACPANLYLEGSDQHRGWFHASLLASVGTRDKAPYQTVLTHGFVVDSQGKKYSKSAKNFVPPDKVLKENGAEILRLWVAAEEYRNDIRVSNEIFTRLIEAYRKIRNTCRYLLGNIFDFDPDTMGGEGLSETDLWALHHLQKLVIKVRKSYEEFNFHVIFHELNRFCTVDLSAFYLDILKDRLYTSAKDDPARRNGQRVLFELATTLARLMAPILSFTSEEIWDHLPAHKGKAASVHLTDLPEPNLQWIDESLANRWADFLSIRSEVLKALELGRGQKVIGNALEAKLILMASDSPQTILKAFQPLLLDLLQVSQIEWGVEIKPAMYQSVSFPGLFIEVVHADGQKCERCWKWSTAVGTFPDHPALCARCRGIVQGMSP